ncbi:MAG: hypothetical protein EBU08_10215 [Micrococcales bacterium]|nr:hypothetical protein [Micrococcales bacterium]
MLDFAGYARSNLFKVKDLDKFRTELDAKKAPISLLYHESLAGFIWTGSEKPFASVNLKDFAKFLAEHSLETVYIITAGSLRGQEPIFECVAVSVDGKVTRNSLKDLIKGNSVNLEDAPVIFKA